MGVLNADFFFIVRNLRKELLIQGLQTGSETNRN